MIGRRTGSSSWAHGRRQVKDRKILRPKEKVARKPMRRGASGMQQKGRRTGTRTPPGKVCQIDGISGYRSPENDLMFHMGWIPAGNEWKRAGKAYLTEHSQHARE
eukprot:6201826-Heterocapsa_arctica.AAC.1